MGWRFLHAFGQVGSGWQAKTLFASHNCAIPSRVTSLSRVLANRATAQRKATETTAAALRGVRERA